MKKNARKRAVRKKLSIIAIIFFIIFNLAISNTFAKESQYEYDGNDYNSNVLEVNKAKPSEVSKYKNSGNDYLIDGYDVNIDVDEYGVMNITEKITIYAINSIHGIKRTIETTSSETSNNIRVTYNDKVSNVSVDAPFEVSTSSTSTIIKIGDATKTFTGEKTYTINYTYDCGNDMNDGYDELYYDIIGDNNTTYVGNVTFTINMPKSFDSSPSKLGFTNGTHGNKTNNIKYEVNGNTITGTYNGGEDGILSPREAVTIRCVLDDGYFEKRSTEYNYVTKKDYRNYLIENLNLDIQVDEFGKLNVNETITVNALKNLYGIKVAIPIDGSIRYENDLNILHKASISNIESSNEFSTNENMNNFFIELKDNEFIGEKTFQVKYTYDGGYDTKIGYDELCFYLLKNEYSTTLKNLTFTITMPNNEFDAKNITFLCGKEDELTNFGVNFSVNDNVITGSYVGNSGILNSDECIVLKCKLKDKYFEKISSTFTKDDFKNIMKILLCVAVAIILFILFGKDKKVIQTIEFYPPKGLSSLDVSYFYSGEIKDSAVVSLLVELAYKGYLKIETDNTNYGNYKIYPLKNADGNLNPEETEFLNSLIRYKGSKEYVSKSDLEFKFYNTIKKIENMEKNKKKLIYKNNALLQYVVYPIIIIILLQSLFGTINIDTNDVITAIFSFLLLFFILSFPLLIGLFCYVIIRKSTTKNRKPIFIEFVGAFGIALFWMIELNNQLYDVFDKKILIEVILANFSIILTIILLSLIPKKTDYGIEMTGKIAGFRDFLIKVEKPRLEVLVRDNPQYFYNILPYTYALGISSIWIKKFIGIAIPSPQFLFDAHSNNFFDYNLMTRTLLGTMNVASSNMTIRPQPSNDYSSSNHHSSGSSSSSHYSGSSSHSSGGGYSGGGHGGGGVSSW